MPGRGGKSGGGLRPKKKPFKPKQQKKRFIRSKDPILAVFMWGIQHSTTELTTSVEPSLLLSGDFKAYSKIRVENQYYNKENLPGHFKFKEYCPRVFYNLRKRFGLDDVEYMNSLIVKPPQPIDSPGRSGSKFFCSYDKKLIVKSISSEEVALLHQILQPYHGHVVTSESMTLLPQYLGCYRLTVNSAESYWIVMRSVFSSSLYMHRKFDLKGSTVDRLASNKEKAKGNPTLKDMDFTESGERITVGTEVKDRITRSLERDVQLLQKLNLMDYSLLVGIYDCTAAPLSEEESMENWYDEDGNDYLSSDELVEPVSPPAAATPPSNNFFSIEEEVVSEDMMEPSTSNPEVDNTDPQQDLTPTVEIHSPMSTVSDTEQEACGGLQPTSPADQEPGSEPASAAGATALDSDEVQRCCPALVRGEKEIAMALAEGKFPVIDTTTDVFAIISSLDSTPQIYFMGLIDVLTNYGARKRAAHAAKTMKHGAGAEISTVKPDQYARRFLEFISKCIV